MEEILARLTGLWRTFLHDQRVFNPATLFDPAKKQKQGPWKPLSFHIDTSSTQCTTKYSDQHSVFFIVGSLQIDTSEGKIFWCYVHKERCMFDKKKSKNHSL